MKKLTKALQIPPKVKAAVRARDNDYCVWCGRPGLAEAHYIPRSHLGLGIEENILTLCRECHANFDGAKRKEMKPYLRGYLQSHYQDWDEQKLIYKKGVQ